MVKTPDELDLMRTSGKLLARVFEMLDGIDLAGMSTLAVNDLVERHIPGDRLPFRAARCAVLGHFQAVGAVDEVDQAGAFRAQRATVHRMIGIAFHVDDARDGIFRAIAQAIQQNAAANGTVRTGIAGLGRASQLVLPYLGHRLPRCETEQGEAGASNRGACHPKELAPGYLNHIRPL